MDKSKKKVVGLLLMILMLLSSFTVLIVFSVNALTMDKGGDTAAPEITVDFEGYMSYDLPVGVVGVQYPVFRATAYDAVDGNCFVTIKITKKKTNKNLYDEGTNTFTPGSEGIYILEYSAEDKSGNNRYINYSIQVYESVASPVINVTAENVTGTTGLSYEIPDATVSGGSGKVEELLTITFGEDTVYSSDSLSKNSFKPTQSGSYLIQYMVSDFLGRTSVKSFTLTAEEQDLPIISPVTLPECALADSPIFFDEFEAVDYAGDGLAKQPEKSIEVNYLGQKITLQEGESFTPVSSGALGAANEMTVTYKAVGSEGTAVLEKKIMVVNVKGEDGYYLPGYMMPDSSAVTVDDTAAMKYKGFQNGSTVSFIKELSSFDFKLNFIASNCSELKIRLYDSQNSSVMLCINFAVKDAKVNVSIDGSEISKNLNIGFGEEFMISYTYPDNKIYVNTNGGNSADELGIIKSDSNGNVFSGFPSGKVKFEIETSECAEGATLAITRIGNLNIAEESIVQDVLAPSVYIEPLKVMRCDVGDKFIVSNGYACDILTQLEEFVVSVKAPDGTIVLPESDADSVYELEATMCGNYRISYRAKDAAGLETTYNKTVQVIDAIPPELALTGNVASSAQIGAEIVLPGYTVNDNFTATEDLSVFVFIIYPSYEQKAIQPDESGQFKFTVEKEGKYIVRYYVEDEDGNYASIDKIITVEA